MCGAKFLYLFFPGHHAMKKTSLEYRVPYADTDQMSVVYYANYLVYFERLRNELLRNLGFPYAEMEARGWQLPVVEAHCNYKKPARYDDLLVITGWLDDCEGAKLRVRCEIYRKDELLASGHTMHVCVLSATGKPTRVPAELKAHIDREK